MDFELCTEFTLCNNWKSHSSIVRSICLSLKENLNLTVLWFRSHSVRLASDHRKTVVFIIHNPNHSVNRISTSWHVLRVNSSDIEALNQLKTVGIYKEPGLFYMQTFPHGSNFEALLIYVFNLKIRKQNFCRHTSICINLKLYKPPTFAE